MSPWSPRWRRRWPTWPAGRAGLPCRWRGGGGDRRVGARERGQRAEDEVLRRAERLGGAEPGLRGEQQPLHEGNIGLADDCRRVVREVIDQHGRLDILANNAGITIDRPVANMSDDDWQKGIAVNMVRSVFMAKAALDHMIERGTGRIISVSSV